MEVGVASCASLTALHRVFELSTASVQRDVRHLGVAAALRLRSADAGVAGDVSTCLSRRDGDMRWGAVREDRGHGDDQGVCARGEGDAVGAIRVGPCGRHCGTLGGSGFDFGNDGPWWAWMANRFDRAGRSGRDCSVNG